MWGFNEMEYRDISRLIFSLVSSQGIQLVVDQLCDM